MEDVSSDIFDLLEDRRVEVRKRFFKYDSVSVTCEGQLKIMSIFL